MFSDVEEYIRVVETEMYEQSPVVRGNLLKLRTDGGESEVFQSFGLAA